MERVFGPWSRRYPRGWLFANTGIRRAPVIQGEVIGIVSVTDILRKAVF
ncbi:hypothetical protein CSW23_13620 [Thermus scotoductus]|uniref:CBS domain-containing protein n=1 Tax=Thermus scotoductus TaxID=37636 RepID=A0A430UW80_THESC|nr:CBS domain-containing protein [Thermus scotoductus]RTG93993.1 hypothetical protein CSW51_08875 [Thermus scotoductus]RTH06219.1 hypothetical protein CSW47_03795 [Thermus scotoductus]RTH22286.1 hypothetical protein CSW38_13505 [Thermus scotoductus]RTH97276.1 hypothetical protein CSW31_12440 [Thermus scotoductus]RTI13496.1 hypothetical protein CSW23_13620 [Thermus scotoductus]